MATTGLGRFPALLREAVRTAELLFVPSRCRICLGLLERPDERVLCRACRAKLKPCRSAYCLCCGRFFPGAAAPHLCRRCLEARPPYAVHRSCAPYEGVLREVIILMKYHGYSVLGRDLAALALDALGEDEALWAGVEAIIPVPLHADKRRKRGFNQAEVVAREIARVKRLPVLGRALVRTRNTPAQTSLEAEDRRRNVAGAMAVRRPGEIEGATVLLLDDVYTTGSTIRECCRALRKARVGEVRALTLARS